VENLEITLETELTQHGIALKEIIPRHSETNAIAEQANRKILTICRTAIIPTKEGIPKSQWDTAPKSAAYIRNRIPHNTLARTPIEIILNRGVEGTLVTARRYFLKKGKTKKKKIGKKKLRTKRNVCISSS
jgi:hypothetical protein